MTEQERTRSDSGRRREDGAAAVGRRINIKRRNDGRNIKGMLEKNTRLKTTKQTNFLAEQIQDTHKIQSKTPMDHRQQEVEELIREFAERKQLELGARIDPRDYRRRGQNFARKHNDPEYPPSKKAGIATSNTKDHKSKLRFVCGVFIYSPSSCLWYSCPWYACSACLSLLRCSI